MNKKIIHVLLSILLLSLLTACPFIERFGDATTIYNHSDCDITCDFVFFDEVFPDTTIPLYNKYLIKVNKGRYITDYVFMEEMYQKTHADTLCFFIFDTDTLAAYDRDIIRNDYKILQRYDLSLGDWKYLGNKIHYPPTEAMKYIKMYPPYKEE